MAATERGGRGGVHTLQVNRAPVMSLWGSVVARRLGHDPETAVGLGEAVSILNARSKGRRLGVFGASKADDAGAAGAEQVRRRRDEGRVELLGRPVPVVNTPGGVRAVIGGDVVDPAKVRRKLGQKFGDALPAVTAAMEELAAGFRPAELAAAAYSLYERFRPTVPPGTKGWGARGVLDLGLIRSLAPSGPGEGKQKVGTRKDPPGRSVGAKAAAAHKTRPDQSPAKRTSGATHRGPARR